MKLIKLCTHARESFKNILHILHSYTTHFIPTPTYTISLLTYTQHTRRRVVAKTTMSKWPSYYVKPAYLEVVSGLVAIQKWPSFYAQVAYLQCMLGQFCEFKIWIVRFCIAIPMLLGANTYVFGV